MLTNKSHGKCATVEEIYNINSLFSVCIVEFLFLYVFELLHNDLQKISKNCFLLSFKLIFSYTRVELMLLAMSFSIQCMEQATSSVHFICQSQRHYQKFLTECQASQTSIFIFLSLYVIHIWNCIIFLTLFYCSLSNHLIIRKGQWSSRCGAVVNESD